MPERAHLEVEEGQTISRRHAAGQDAARGERHAGHHRRSAARHRNLRSPQAEGPGRHRRDRRHGRAVERKEAAASGSIIVRSESGIEREHLITHDKHLRVHSGDFGARRRRAWSTGRSCRTTSCGSPAKRPCSSTCPRNPERLPQPARRDQRQAHRDHRRADAAQGADRDTRATPTCCRAA